MVEVYRDLSRLELLCDTELGLEKIDFAMRSKDFLDYYFNRFGRNLRSMFKDFSHSEIFEYEKRYRRALTYALSSSKLSFDDLIVPTPRGMIGSYSDTTHALTAILKAIRADDLVADLTFLSEKKTIPSPMLILSSDEFEKHKKTISELFSAKSRLDYSIASHALKSLADTKSLLTELVEVTSDYYPKTMEVKSALMFFDAQKIEDAAVATSGGNSSTTKHHDNVIQNGSSPVGFTADTKIKMLGLAYRLSLFGVTMDLIQQIEHSFIGAIEVIRKKEH